MKGTGCMVRARPQRAVAVSLAAIALAVAVTRETAADPVEPPTLSQAPTKRTLQRCYPVESRVRHEEATVIATLRVDESGRVTSVAFPEDTPDHLRQATECVASELRFSPARVAGHPASAEVAVPFDFGLSYRGEDREPEVFAPTLRSSQGTVRKALQECYPPDFNGVGEVTVAAVVRTDGRPERLRVVASGGRPEVDQVALCVMEKLRFRPGRRGSDTVDMDVTWMIRVLPP